MSIIDKKLIYKYLAGETTPDENKKVEEWRDQNQSNRKQLENLKKIWDVKPRKEFTTDIEASWQKLEKMIGEDEESEKAMSPVNKMKGRRTYSWENKYKVLVRVAAVVILGFLISVSAMKLDWLSKQQQDDSQPMREVLTSRGQRVQMKFSDGTEVTLNSESQLKYPEKFTGENREVFLEGEAFFNVTHKDGVKFIVHTNDAKVTVLGTKFNVKAREELQNVKVVVSEGKVAVRPSGKSPEVDSNRVILTNNEMATVFRNQVPITVRKVKASKYLGWTRGDFVFDETPLSEILRDWERQYDINFIVKDSTLLSTRFSGEFERESLDEMVRLLSISLKFDYSRNGNTITFTPDTDLSEGPHAADFQVAGRIPFAMKSAAFG